MLGCIFVILTLSSHLVHASSKKGMALCGATYKCGDTYALGDSSWWYNWHYQMEEYHGHHCAKWPHGEFVPMIWSERYIHEANIPGHSTHVLGFNEPNAKNQANMSPEHAASLWPQVERIAGQRTLISPALAGCDSNPDMCISWYDRFFKACHNCRVDRIAFHGYHCVPYQMMQSIERIYKRFGRKIWLTEFACTTSHSVDEQIRFMQTLVPLLEKAPFVEKYAWFCSRSKMTGSWNLLNENSPTASRLGRAYNNIH